MKSYIEILMEAIRPTFTSSKRSCESMAELKAQEAEAATGVREKRNLKKEARKWRQRAKSSTAP